MVFADDLNSFKEYAIAKENKEAFEAAKTCQEKLHTWDQCVVVAVN